VPRRAASSREHLDILCDHHLDQQATLEYCTMQLRDIAPDAYQFYGTLITLQALQQWVTGMKEGVCGRCRSLRRYSSRKIWTGTKSLQGSPLEAFIC
jgi:hypothetical protein